MSVYVMSDIHGLMPRFKNMLEKIAFNDNDHLYILGDVIDRGKDGIALLMYIKEHTNMTLIMGNHEYMMWQYYMTLKTSTPDERIISRWHRNQCTPTMKQYEACTLSQQEQLLEYLASLPIAISDVCVNGKIFYLVHGAPITSLKEGSVYMDSEIMKLFKVDDFVWERIIVENLRLKDRTLIVGHTITAFYHDKKPYRIWYDNATIEQSKMIAIDCGCACDDANTQLACLRLDDYEIFYT